MNNNMHYSLLDDPLISVRYRNEEVRKSTLPEIYTALLDDNIIGFEALQPHQQQAWFSFLVQLATMAVAREADREIPEDPESWKTLLINLANGSEAAWHLVVEDVSKPAFMQSPVPEGSLEKAGYKPKYKTPDDIDILITSKNHDLKSNRILNAEAEHWLFALITLQTMQGYIGRKYGIVRMDGREGNRPFVGLVPRLYWGIRFLRDVNVLLNKRSTLVEFYNLQGYSLLWNLSWDGSKEEALQLWDCDPYVIEICRRIRFLIDKGEFKCWRAVTDTDRIDAPDNLRGVTHDPWTPINLSTKEPRSLTVYKDGFDYKLIHQILLGEEYKWPIALEFQENEKDGAYFISSALVRGRGQERGKTFGLHQRKILIPPQVTSKLFSDESKKEKLAERSRRRITLTAEVQDNVLKPAIRKLIQGGLNKKTSRQQTIAENKKIKPWTNRFDQAIDDRFFESLWVSVEMEPDEARKQWQIILFEEAEKLLQEAERSIPLADLRRLRAVSQARSKFYGRCKDILDLAHQEKVSTNQTKENHEY